MIEGSWACGIKSSLLDATAMRLPWCKQPFARHSARSTPLLLLLFAHSLLLSRVSIACFVVLNHVPSLCSSSIYWIMSFVAILILCFLSNLTKHRPGSTNQVTNGAQKKFPSTAIPICYLLSKSSIAPSWKSKASE